VPGGASDSPLIDHNEDGQIGGLDFAVFVAQFIAGVPGPSGLIGAGLPGCTQSP